MGIEIAVGALVALVGYVIVGYVIVVAVAERGPRHRRDGE